MKVPETNLIHPVDAKTAPSNLVSGNYARAPRIVCPQRAGSEDGLPKTSPPHCTWSTVPGALKQRQSATERGKRAAYLRPNRRADALAGSIVIVIIAAAIAAVSPITVVIVVPAGTAVTAVIIVVVVICEEHEMGDRCCREGPRPVMQTQVAQMQANKRVIRGGRAP